LFSALKVPRRYLGFDGGESRASLSQEDIRFARTVQRLQREVRNGYKKVCRIHLAALNIDPDQIDFDLRMTTSSTVFELSQLELMNARAGTAQSLMEYMPKEWILEHIFEFSKDDAIFIQKAKQTEMRDDAVFNADTEVKVMEKTGSAQLDLQTKAMEAQTAMGVPVEGEVETEMDVPEEEPAEESVAYKKMYANIDRRIAALARDAEKMRREQRDQNDSVVSLLEDVAPMIKDVHKILRRSRAATAGTSQSRRRIQ
jgi:hypothetical protein